MTSLAEILDRAERGIMPRPGGGPTLVPQPSPRDAGVIAFTGHSVVFADAGEDWIRARLDRGDLSAPLGPRFLVALEERLGRRVDNVDLLALARPLPGPAPVDLEEITGPGHARLERARHFRDEVRAWACPGGIVIIGRGVAGRPEVAIEVEPGARGRGLGRSLARAARHLAPGPLWAQIAPGNAASVRCFLAAGFEAVGAEVLLVG